MGFCRALTGCSLADAVYGLRWFISRLVVGYRLFLTALGFSAGMLGCSSSDVQPVMSNVPPPDFSGYWEVDYARSDSIQNQLNSTFREVQREIRRRNESAEKGSPYHGTRLGDVDTLFALAKMAELVAEPTLLEIEQDTQWIRIERENSFALICSLDVTGDETSRLGREICWWDGQQWHFVIQLPDGLNVAHRFTRSGDGNSLAQRTKLSDPRTGHDFVISQVFGRYDPTKRGYSCIETLSRGRVCTTEDVDLE